MTSLPAEVEVAVVGAGPAGTAAALALRREGVEVLLIDRARFPREKVCGDVLLPEAVESLERLGLDTATLREVAYGCFGARYWTPRGSKIAGPFRDPDGEARPWSMVPRRELDRWLLEETRRTGARVMEGARVDAVVRDAAGGVVGVRVGSSTVRARVVVGADGASSIVARAVGAYTQSSENTCLAARAYVDIALPEPYLEVFTVDRALPGCAWIVPIGSSRANVGVGVVQRTAEALGRTPQALFEEIRAESPPLGERLADAGSIRLKGWTLPAATEGRPLAGDGWVLVGDAGGMVDPFTGHGIQNALAAGIAAGETIAGSLRAGDEGSGGMRRYERRIREELKAEVGRGAVLQRLHARPALMRATAALCKIHPGLRATFLGLVGHSAPRERLTNAAALARALLRVREAA